MPVPVEPVTPVIPVTPSAPAQLPFNPDAGRTKFTDASDVSAWAVSAMQWAVGQGLIQGLNSGQIRPQSNASRAEVATILMRFCELLNE